MRTKRCPPKDQIKSIPKQKGKYVNRQIKNSVFTTLFADPKYQIMLYQALHPEDTASTVKDISNVTLQAVMVNGLYNDMGMIVCNRLLVLVEAQSTWSENIIMRLLMYAMKSYNDYFTEHSVNLYSSQKADIPKPEFYVIFTGKRKKHPRMLSFKNVYFPNQNCMLDVKAKIIYNGRKGDIIQQYVFFAQVWDEQFKRYGNSESAIKETIRICNDHGVLTEFLKQRRKELMDIMTALFDQKEVNRRYHLEIQRNAKAEGKAEDIVEVMKKLKCDFTEAMDFLNIPEDERKDLVKLFNSKQA